VNNSIGDGDDVRIGAEIVFGAQSVGYVLGMLRDPISQRIRRIITAYGPDRREVAIPVEWVVRHTPARITLGIGTRSLDNLVDRRDLGPLHFRAAATAVNGAAV
jgi:hypothetical protein